MMHNGPFKNIVDAVRDWINSKEEQYLPGEIYESVPNEIIKMLWDGDTKFDDLTPVSGVEELTPTSKLDNYLHFIKIFYDIEEIKQNALTFTNEGDSPIDIKLTYSSRGDVRLGVFYNIINDEIVPYQPVITLNPGESAYYIGYNPEGINFNNYEDHRYISYYFTVEGDSKYSLSGNIMSLIDIIGKTNSIPDTGEVGCFEGLFYDNQNLIRVSNSLLPATELAEGCYRYLFAQCTNLINTPNLPATELAECCYSGMFFSCTSLVESPDLPATKLAAYCYCNMFGGCTSLVEFPNLPATELAEHCYESMFMSCTSVVDTDLILPAKHLPSYCYSYMFAGCNALENSPIIDCKTYETGALECMFMDCSSLRMLYFYGTQLLTQEVADYFMGNCPYNGRFYKDYKTNTDSWRNEYREGSEYWGIIDEWLVCNGNQPFKITSTDSSEPIVFGRTDGERFDVDLEYSFDCESWYKITSEDSDSVKIPLQQDNVYGYRVYLRANRPKGYSIFDQTVAIEDRGYYRFDFSGKQIMLSGNIQSILTKNNFHLKLDVPEAAFMRMFYSSGAESIEFPDYSDFAQDASYPPEATILFARHLAPFCYLGMFAYNSMRRTPFLLAKELGRYSYKEMFRGCTDIYIIVSIAEKINEYIVHRDDQGQIISTEVYYNAQDFVGGVKKQYGRFCRSKNAKVESGIEVDACQNVWDRDLGEAPYIDNHWTDEEYTWMYVG